MGTTIKVKNVDTVIPKISAQARPEKIGSNVMGQAASMAEKEVSRTALVRKAPASMSD